MLNEPPREGPTAFLLAQVGAYAGRKFAEKIAPLNLNPPHAGILRILQQTAGISQRELASRLRMHPSQLVALVDEMEALGLLARKPNENDRRSYALQLTDSGREALLKIRDLGREHSEALLFGLAPEERVTLSHLLERIATHHGLTRGVHPGYSTLNVAPAGPGGHSPSARTARKTKPRP